MPGKPDDNSINPTPTPQDDPVQRAAEIPFWQRRDDDPPAELSRPVLRRPIVKGGGLTVKRIPNSGIAPRAKKTTTKKSQRKKEQTPKRNFRKF